MKLFFLFITLFFPLLSFSESYEHFGFTPLKKMVTIKKVILLQDKKNTATAQLLTNQAAILLSDHSWWHCIYATSKENSFSQQLLSYPPPPPLAEPLTANPLLWKEGDSITIHEYRNDDEFPIETIEEIALDPLPFRKCSHLLEKEDLASFSKKISREEAIALIRLHRKNTSTEISFLSKSIRKKGGNTP